MGTPSAKSIEHRADGNENESPSLIKPEEEKVNDLDRALRAQLDEPSPGEGLSWRVDELIESHRSRQLLSSMGTLASVSELALRSEGLEQAVRDLAAAVDEIAANRQN